MLESFVSSCKGLKTSNFECFCIIMLYKLGNLCPHKATLMLKSSSGDDENYTVCALGPRNLHCVIPLLKVDSGRPLVTEILADFCTPGCFSKL